MSAHQIDLIEVAVIIAVVLLGLWIIGIKFYRRDKGRARIVLAWPTTQGEVLWCGVKSTVYDPDIGTAKFLGLNFVYTVGDRRIISSSSISRVTFGREGKFLEKYRKGTSITVHYNPDNPSENRVVEITKDIGPVALVIFIVAGVATIFFIAMLSATVSYERRISVDKGHYHIFGGFAKSDQMLLVDPEPVVRQG